MQFHLPQTRRAYVRSFTAGIGAFVFVVLTVHGLLTSLALHAEATYLDDVLVGIAVTLLVLVLEAKHESDVAAERERALLSLGLNHHIRNALQTIIYIGSNLPDTAQAELLNDAARRIEWALREVPKQAQAHEAVSEITGVKWKAQRSSPEEQKGTGPAP